MRFAFFGRLRHPLRAVASIGQSRRRAAQPLHPLLEDLGALDARQRRELACALSMLWDEFTGEGAGSGDSPAPDRAGAAYVRSMHLAAHRVRRNGGPEKLHYALAPELMALYAEALLKRDATPRDREIAASVREVAAQGGLIRRAGSGRSPKRKRIAP